MPDPALPAIVFEPDGYDVSGPKLMGRQAAGHAFMRAAAQVAGTRALVACTPHRQSAEVFQRMLQHMSPQTPARWVPSHRLDLLAEVGALYLPGPDIGQAARLRLRVGPGAYSLCGVTHTTASHGAMDAIKALVSAPVMPWDALICTSQAVRATVDTIVRAEHDYLRWRLGATTPPPMPQLPVIPLGVHTADFSFTDDERTQARQALGLQPDEVVALFVGRLSFHAKAHPHALYQGLQQAVQRTGQRVALIQCGWFANDFIAAAFKDGARQVCPGVRCLFTDGKSETARRQSWAAADVFISLSDNIQETFGLTPIEAMAAGLPVVVTDWDGYKDTVRDGLDGFRIPTYMPAAGLGEDLARAHESGQENYDRYCGLTCQSVALDMPVLVSRLVDLIERPALRAQLGRQAQAHARQDLDWAVVMSQYQALWGDLHVQRRARATTALPTAPTADAARLDPFTTFDGYASHRVDGQTLVSLSPGHTPAQWAATMQMAMFSYALQWPGMQAAVDALWPLLAEAARPASHLAAQTGLGLAPTVRAICLMAKAGAVRLG